MLEYAQQAIDFLKMTKSTIRIIPKNNRNGRAVYDITLTTTIGEMNFQFWNSLYNTEILNKNLEEYTGRERSELVKKKMSASPTAYDVLVCITKYDPGSFENFCSDYGYDKYDKSSYKIYMDVKNEFNQLKRIFTEDEMKELLNIY